MVSVGSTRAEGRDTRVLNPHSLTPHSPHMYTRAHSMYSTTRARTNTHTHHLNVYSPLSSLSHLHVLIPPAPLPPFAPTSTHPPPPPSLPSPSHSPTHLCTLKNPSIAKSRIKSESDRNCDPTPANTEGGKSIHNSCWAQRVATCGVGASQLAVK